MVHYDKRHERVSIMKIGRVLLAGLVIGGALQLPMGASATAATSGSAPAASYAISPNPIAATDTLAPGATATLTLTALTKTGNPDPSAEVWIKLLSRLPDGHNSRVPVGHLTVEASAVGSGTAGEEVKVDQLGQVTLIYTAGTALKAGYEDGVWAQRSGGEFGPKTEDWYVY